MKNETIVKAVKSALKEINQLDIICHQEECTKEVITRLETVYKRLFTVVEDVTLPHPTKPTRVFYQGVEREALPPLR